MTEFERGYISGIIDGEGCIGLVKQNSKNVKRGFSWVPKLTITNSNLIMLLEVKRILGGGKIYKHSKPIFGRKPLFKYQGHANLLRKILPQLNLIIKDNDKQLILEALGLLAKRNKHYPAPIMDNTLSNIHRKMQKYVSRN